METACHKFHEPENSPNLTAPMKSKRLMKLYKN